MATPSVLNPTPPAGFAACQNSIFMAFSHFAKDPNQVPFIMGLLNASVNELVTQGNWGAHPEEVKGQSVAGNACFKLRDGYRHIQTQNPNQRFEMPPEFFAITKLCKAVQNLRHPPPVVNTPAVPPPIIAQATPALPSASSATETPRSRPKPRPKTRSVKSKATVDSEDDEVRFRRLFNALVGDLIHRFQDVDMEEVVIVAEGPAPLKLGSSSKGSGKAGRAEAVMLDYADVPGMDAAALEKANAKLAGTASSSKKARTDDTIATPSLGLSPSAAAIERAIVKLEEEHADLDFRVAYATQQLDLVNLELERQRRKLEEATGDGKDVKGKGKAPAQD